REPVGANDQDQSHETLEEPDRRCEAVVTLLDATEEDEGVEYVTDLHRERIEHQEDLLEAGVQHVSEPQDKQDDNDRLEARKDDVTDSLQPAGAVEHCRLVQLWVNPGQGREKDDGAPTCFLPYNFQYDQRGRTNWGA